MSDELEFGALASAGSLSTNDSKVEADGEPCRNCDTPVHGKYCSECGQLAQNFHKPIMGLIAEGLGDFFSLDGRMARTLPGLLFIPGRVTRAYLEGKRQRFVPPFRLYLITSFIFFITMFSVAQYSGWIDLGLTEDGVAAIQEATDEALNDDALQDVGDVDTAPDREISGPVSEVTSDTQEEDRKSELEKALPPGLKGKVLVDGEAVDLSETDEDVTDYVFAKGDELYKNRALIFASITNWAPRLAFLFTPAMIVCLLIVFPFRKQVYVYDHVITSLHFQSWLYLLSTVCFLLIWGHQYWAWMLFFLAPPVYIYRLLRTVYGAGRILAVMRTLFILFMFNIAFFFWVLMVIIVGVGESGSWQS